MIYIFEMTFGLFALIALGYVLAMFRVFSVEQSRVFGKYVLNIALPALIFLATARGSQDRLFDAHYLISYTFSSLMVMSLGLFLSRLVKNTPPSETVFLMAGGACANSGFIGYPLLFLIMPDLAGQVLAMNMIVENLLILPLILILAERAQGVAAGGQLIRSILRRLMTSPILWAICAGLVLRQSGVFMPDALTRPLSLIAQSSTALSLITIGASLTLVPWNGFGAVRVWLIVGLKLLVMPTLFAGVGFFLISLGLRPAEAAFLTAGVLMAATPQMGVYPVLAQQYGAEKMAAAAMLLSTLLSFGTLSLLLSLLA